MCSFQSNQGYSSKTLDRISVLWQSPSPNKYNKKTTTYLSKRLMQILVGTNENIRKYKIKYCMMQEDSLRKISCVQQASHQATDLYWIRTQTAY